MNSYRRTRFAPSPTGFLHLGHVASALCVWAASRKFGIPITLRIEDHDRQRCRPEFVEQIHVDLQWLGFTSGDAGSCVDSFSQQSKHWDRYELAAERLRQHKLIYYCQCSRKEIQSANFKLADIQRVEELYYPGTCRHLNLTKSDRRGLRAILAENSIKYKDVLMRSEIEHSPSSQCGDVLIQDRNGNWTYQFAVVVDDMEEDVDLIIRGMDILSATGRQIMLATMLGRKNLPSFGHHSLIVDEQQKKLSKRDGSEAVAAQRSQGVSAERLLADATRGIGVLDCSDQLSMDEAIELVSKRIFGVQRLTI